MSQPFAFNPSDPEYQADPYPTLHRMQREQPVYWSEALQAWFLTRYRDVHAAARDPRLSSRDRTARFFAERMERAGANTAMARAFIEMSQGRMNDMDAPEHDRIRQAALPVFHADVLDPWRARVEEMAEELLGKVEGERFDLVEAYSKPLPLMVITTMLGIPVVDRYRMEGWAHDLGRVQASSVERMLDAARAAEEATVGLQGYLRSLVRARRGRPGDDLCSYLVQAEREGAITEEEIITQLILFIRAGTVPVADQLGNGIQALLRHPGSLTTLREHPEYLPSAVEEMFRYDAAMPFQSRWATEDLEIGGTRISRGQVVYLGFGAGNRDEEVFEEPDRFDITRQGESHLAFGVGPHACLGAALGRLELRAALEVLLRRMPGLRLDPDAGPVVGCATLMSRGLRSLPVIR